MIYLLEDDQNIRKLVNYALSSNGFTARGFSQPDEFWEAMKGEVPQMILLDIMLPQEDGLEILQKLRAAPRTMKVPVILLTAKDSEFDKVTGLDLGADDYIPKPFGMLELISRVRAVLRRSPQGPEETSYALNGLYVCPARHEVRVDGQEITLALKEYQLLCALLEAGGAVRTRDQLLRAIWGYRFDGESRTVDVHIRKLRQKLGEYGACIETVKGVGYKIGEMKT